MNINIIASDSSGNALTLFDGYTTVLIDCGVALKKLSKGGDFKLSNVKAALFSHVHL